ncbi:ABC transporter substrate-binding protein [Natrarchaeobaculum sulfurireducens]|uniref:ABC-type transport system, periplasmic component n=1 Tax=Natrarchaeobaculum sulfurireducens TaxID=2044521 RepID=A0A346PHD6_9EURY|nr:ABC transporter substrate-binding protein [Natrarchaeobaculum sulfurireducens]AXR78931.1 ABC-type transport system, periplasmic component [Natrarchaeobaculum sulfurireducens]
MDASEGWRRRGSRRSVLSRIGAAVTVGLAGCVTADENETRSDSEGADDEAIALVERGLEAAGVDPPVETTIYANVENDERVRWAQLVQQELNETGLFDVSFEQLEWGQYQDLCFSMADSEENALVTLDVSGGWDPHTYLEPLFHSEKAAPSGLNFNHFESETVDELLEAGLAESDETHRRELYAELQEELVRRAPVSIVRFGESATVYRRDVVDDWRSYPLPGSEYESVFAPYAETAVSISNTDRLVGDAIASISNTDPVQMHDTTSNMATTLLYEGLLGVDFDGTPRPQLATDWERLDETTYRFDLRSDVTFHNGESLTAEHVQFSLERYDGTPREADVFEWLDAVDVLDDSTLEISLTEPYGPFETSANVPIVPLAAGEDGDVDLVETPVGTGPYQFAGQSSGEYWDLERFEDHWAVDEGGVDSQPVETIRLRVLTDAAARQAALEAGEIDVATGLTAESVDQLASDETYGVERTVAGQYDFLIYPTYLAPFDEVDVRRGIDRLLPRDRIVETVYAGSGTVAYTPVPPLLESFVDPAFEAHILDEFFG